MSYAMDMSINVGLQCPFQINKHTNNNSKCAVRQASSGNSSEYELTFVVTSQSLFKGEFICTANTHLLVLICSRLSVCPVPIVDLNKPFPVHPTHIYCPLLVSLNVHTSLMGVANGLICNQQQFRFFFIVSQSSTLQTEKVKLL